MPTDSVGNIFVVDDDRFVLESVTTLLTEYGFSVRAFSSGHDAIKRFIMEPVDLVLTDINMPVMDGLELLRKSVFDRETPVVLMTAYADLTWRSRRFRRGLRPSSALSPLPDPYRRKGGQLQTPDPD
jgi:CheY-like chemotaxis protein